MKPSLAIFALISTIAVTTEATDPAALINFKSQIGNFILNAATSAIQAKQNLVRSSTSAIINAKTNFLQRQLPHLVQFKTNQINSVLELKKNLIRSKAPQTGQLAGGNAIQSAEQGVAPYSPPAAPPAPIEEPQTSYSPLPPLQPLATPAPPVEAPLGPYPPASFAKRQTNNNHIETARVQPSFRPQRAPSHDSRYTKTQYSDFPTPPPPPVLYMMHV